MIGKGKKLGTYLLLGVIIIGLIGFSVTTSVATVLEIAASDGEKDAEVEAFIEEFDSVSKEMSTAIADDSTAAGIDAAQKAFDAKKDSLKEKFASFKNARVPEVSDKILKKLTNSITTNGKAIVDAFSKNAADYSPEDIPKFQKLMKDYTDTFQM
jgi:hypothetical protein